MDWLQPHKDWLRTVCLAESPEDDFALSATLHAHIPQIESAFGFSAYASTYPRFVSCVRLGTVVLLLALLLFHSQIRQDFGVFFRRSQKLVARRTVVGDGLAICAGVTAVMTAETAR